MTIKKSRIVGIAFRDYPRLAGYRWAQQCVRLRVLPEGAARGDGEARGRTWLERQFG